MYINVKAVKQEVLKVAKEYNPNITRVSKEAILSIDSQVSELIRNIAANQNQKGKTVLPVVSMEAAQ